MYMKKVVLLAFLITQFVMAQTEKGKFVISGKTGIDFSWINSKSTSPFGTSKTKTSSFEFSPTAAYFVNDNFFIGLTSLYSYEHTNFNLNSTQSNTLYTLMPTAGYYFVTETKFRPFISGGFGLVNSKSTFRGTPMNPTDPTFINSFTAKSNGFVANIAAGVSYFVAENISFDGQLAYNYVSLRDKNFRDAKTTSSGIGFSFGISVFF
jgi:outer membrane protein